MNWDHYKKLIAPLKKSGRFVAAGLTGALLFMSFPPFDLSYLGWVALIPLVLACSGVSVRRAALLGWLGGAVFFFGSLIWLRHVTWLGFIALAFYCALYLIPFAIYISMKPGRWRGWAGLKNMGWIAGASAVWAASEYLRATLITGFPWNPLGVSQYEQSAFIQLAEWGGVYLLSALMVYVNTAGAVTLLQYLSGRRNTGYRIHLELMSAVFLVALASTVGMRSLLASPPAGRPVRAALIQPNIAEVGNWEPPDPALTCERLEELTDIASHSLNLDLIIWPETAIPDFVRFTSRSAELVQRVTGAGVPLLAGSMDYIWRAGARPDYYNGSMLFNASGELLGSYYKQHLVLFGEYIPFEGKIPLINALTPIGSSFKSGTETALFKLPGDARAFSVLICFEDTLPYLARRAAQRGATWLVNQTNDSWFDPDCGSKQHLANAVFRCVETRLPMVRCTNTGATCLIDAKGRITQTLAPRVQGFQVVELTPADPSRSLPVHTRYGDWFAQACLLCGVALLIGALIKRKRTNHA